MKKQIPLFLIIGGIGFVIDAAGVYVLVTMLGFNPFWGRVPGFALAICVTFLLNRHVTFKQDKPVSLIQAFTKYIAANGISQGTNFAIYSILVAQIAFFANIPIAAVFIGSAIAAVLSFILFKKMVFKAHA